MRGMSKYHNCRSNYVVHLAEGFDRLDVVFDRYFKNSFSGAISSANQKRTRFVRYTGVTDN